MPTGVPSTIDEEFNSDLDYTEPGALAMARTSSPNSSSTEFFDTEAAARNLDFGYSLFWLANHLIQPSPLTARRRPSPKRFKVSLPETSSGFSYLDTPVKITSATVFTDTQNGVLMLKSPVGATGTATITVTAYDGTNTPTTQTFTATAATDTGAVNANPWAADVPAAPTSIQLSNVSGTASTSTITSDDNSSSAKALNFLVSGVTAGNTVTIYADGNAFASAVVPAGDTSVVITTDGATGLGQGQYTFDAVQTAPNVSATDPADADPTTKVALTESSNVASVASKSQTITVFTDLFPTNEPATTAQVGKVYTYSLQTDAPAGDPVTVTPVTLPAGMTTDGNGNFTWTPTKAEGGTTQTFSIDISDAAGNSRTSTLQIVVGSDLTPVAIPASSSGGNITVTFNGSNATFYDNIGKKTLATLAFTSIDTMQVICPTGQANVVTIVAPTSTTAPHPAILTVESLGSSTANSHLIYRPGQRAQINSRCKATPWPAMGC